MNRWFCVLLAVLASTRPAVAGSFRIGAVFDWHQASRGNRVTGLLLLELPLDRMASPRIPLRASSATRRELGTGPGLLEPNTAERSESQAGSGRAPAAFQRATGDAIDYRWVRRLVAAALRSRGAPSSAERLDSLSARSRSSAALPELTLRAVRSTDEALRLSPASSSGTPVYDYTQSGGAGLVLEARATWRLDRLVFADEELRVERLRAQRAELAQHITNLVLKNVVAWHRARTRLAEIELTADEQLALEAQLFEAEAALDVLTEGLFSAEATVAVTGRAPALGPVRPEQLPSAPKP